MVTDPEHNAVVQALGELAEKYLDAPRLCFVCREMPAVMPLVYVADTPTADRMSGCVFGVCAFCLCDEDFQARVGQMFKQGQRRREAGAWN